MKNIRAQIFWLNLFKTYKSGLILVLVIGIVVIADLLFYQFIYRPLLTVYFSDVEKTRKMIEGGNIISFAPEAWLSLLGLVLGTLIIVISVASQSTPKLIDLYTGDQTSLWYIWYIVVGSVHNMTLQLYSSSFTIGPGKVLSDILLNTYLMLPLALLLAVPYVLYILRYTKTSNVINKIFKDNIRRIHELPKYAAVSLLHDKKLRDRIQFEMFESLNQLDDLLEYVSFKDPKGDIMNKISLLLQEYVAIKAQVKVHCPDFFLISPRIRQDVSFKTMTGQFDEMERGATFYEQKGFRLLGNAYIKLIEHEDFDLASLCASELAECGHAAIKYEDLSLINVVLIRFNTLLRFGIKHGLKNKEARNLYNAIFHYCEFIRFIVESKNRELIDKSCRYLNIYINEIYQHSRKERSFGFLVDVFTWEFKRVLIALNENGIDIEQQKEILSYFLKIDNLSDAYEETPLKGRKFSSGIRGMQISLALYYLSTNKESLAESIIIDILNDHEFMDRETLRKEVSAAGERLKTKAALFGKILTGAISICTTPKIPGIWRFSWNYLRTCWNHSPFLPARFVP
ncbi:MAG: hypothetical protein HC913_19900 [Microscillaceae bacterium]|nr:hypothetical protein [Microscillaceae bacterium]